MKACNPLFILGVTGFVAFLALAGNASSQTLVPVPSTTDTTSTKTTTDTTTAAKGDPEEAGIQFVERQFDHKQQVIVGGVVMLCVGLVLVAMNNYNPKR